MDLAFLSPDFYRDGPNPIVIIIVISRITIEKKNHAGGISGPRTRGLPPPARAPPGTTEIRERTDPVSDLPRQGPLALGFPSAILRPTVRGYIVNFGGRRRRVVWDAVRGFAR